MKPNAAGRGGSTGGGRGGRAGKAPASSKPRATPLDGKAPKSASGGSRAAASSSGARAVPANPEDELEEAVDAVEPGDDEDLEDEIEEDDEDPAVRQPQCRPLAAAVPRAARASSPDAIGRCAQGGVEEWPKLSTHQPSAPHVRLELGPRPRAASSAIYPPTAFVPANVNQYLRDYQREGVQWMWKQYVATPPKGGILGDEMGLGKTVQVAAFLSAVLGKTATSEDKQRAWPMPEDDCRQALVVVPTSTLSNWERELATWGYFKVRRFHGATKDEALLAVRERRCEILLTTYGTMSSRTADLASIEWEISIWDELHTLKNERTQGAKAAREIPCKRRFGLTGTPMSNNFLELWVVRHAGPAP